MEVKKYNFQLEVDKMERKHRKEELDLLRAWVQHLATGLSESEKKRITSMFGNAIGDNYKKTKKKDLTNLGQLIERTLENKDALYLTAIHASFCAD